MIRSCKGIVLHRFKYLDNSSIVKIFTNHFGLQSYLVHNSRNKKNKVKILLLQPMSIIDFVADIKEDRGLQRIRELRSDYFSYVNKNNAVRNAIMIFLAEVLLKSLSESFADEELFNFIHNSIEKYDKNPSSDFHILFLIKLTKFLGFFPLIDKNNTNRFFDLKNGNFLSSSPSHQYFLDENLSALLFKFLNMEFYDLEMPHLSSSNRSKLLQALLNYFQLHNPAFKEINSRNFLEII